MEEEVPILQNHNYNTCNLEACKNDRVEFSHKMPGGKEKRRKWITAILDAGASVYRVNRICPRHFRPEDYVQPNSRFLNRVAVPSLNLKELDALDKCRQIRTIKAIRSENTKDNQDVNLAKDDNGLKRSHDEIAASEKENCENEEVDLKKVKLQLNMKNEIIESTEEPIRQSADEQDVYMTMEDLESTHPFTVCITNNDINGVNEQNFDEQEQHENDKCIIVHIESSDVNELQETEEENETVPITESEIKIDGRQLIIQHVDFEETRCLDFTWLRDFCKCEECYNNTTGLRKLDLLALPTNLQPQVTTLCDDNLFVKWNDGHASTYSLVEIFLSQTAQDITSVNNQIPWNAKLTNFREDFNPIKYNDLICSDAIENAALDRLQRSGVLLITGLSVDAKQQPLMIELLMRRLFPCIYQSFVHERRKDFLDAPHQKPHTNCTFLSESCGLQILSLCPTTNMAAELDVKFTCLDGLNAAVQLRAMARHSFDCLKNVKLPFVYRNFDENFDYCTEAPVIEFLNDMSFKRIRYAPYQRGTMPQKNLPTFIEALRKLTKIIENEKNLWTFNLQNDMLIILDNWRICWQLSVGKESKSNPSNLALNCIYVERKNALSRLNRLQTV